MMTKVFLSSTVRDLEEYRAAVYDTIHSLDGMHCIAMEDFGSREKDAANVCRDKVLGSDLYVGVLGHCYGSCPEDSSVSYTELEYCAARNQNKDCLAYLLNEDANPILIQADCERERQRSFRDRVRRDVLPAHFTTPEELARLVVAGIYNWRRRRELRHGALFALGVDSGGARLRDGVWALVRLETLIALIPIGLSVFFLAGALVGLVMLLAHRLGVVGALVAFALGVLGLGLLMVGLWYLWRSAIALTTSQQFIDGGRVALSSHVDGLVRDQRRRRSDERAA